jgi:hypothetical protein
LGGVSGAAVSVIRIIRRNVRLPVIDGVIPCHSQRNLSQRPAPGLALWVVADTVLGSQFLINPRKDCIQSAA